MANKGFPDSKPGEKGKVPASHCPRFCADTNITNHIERTTSDVKQQD